jgi:hypothetical protein
VRLNKPIRACGLLLVDYGFAQSPIAKDGRQGAAQTITTDKRGTQEAPLAVRIIPSPDAEARAVDEKRERDEKAAADNLLVKSTYALFWATVALGAIAAIQVGFFW